MNKKDDKKAFDNIFSIARLYNSACLFVYAANPIRIYPIMISIVLHNYKILKEKNFDKYYHYHSDFNEINSYNSRILKREIGKWKNFSYTLRKHNRELFNEMLQSSSSYKYSNAINAKGEQFSTVSLIISFLL